MLVGPLQGSS
uniref:Uncharacterized protein n=1 Tax=Arundo donax TaxID=35708 RepID=A0A0A8ZQ52_ARUDO